MSAKAFQNSHVTNDVTPIMFLHKLETEFEISAALIVEKMQN